MSAPYTPPGTDPTGYPGPKPDPPKPASEVPADGEIPVDADEDEG